MVQGIKNVLIYLGQWNTASVTVRLLVALLCGGLIGLSRSVKRRGAGFKTHVLVSIGSALIMMTGQYIYENFQLSGDIARLGAQIVSGVGFLGVGTIIVTGQNQVKGLTTAAGLWTCAGIGLSIGIGFYTGGLITTVLVLILYRYMDRIDEYAYEHARVLDLYIEFESRKVISGFIDVLKEKEYKIIQLEFNKPKKNKDEIVNATLVLEVSSKVKHQIILKNIREIEGVIHVEQL